MGNPREKFIVVWGGGNALYHLLQWASALWMQSGPQNEHQCMSTPATPSASTYTFTHAPYWDLLYTASRSKARKDLCLGQEKGARTDQVWGTQTDCLRRIHTIYWLWRTSQESPKTGSLRGQHRQDHLEDLSSVSLKRITGFCLSSKGHDHRIKNRWISCFSLYHARAEWMVEGKLRD